MDHLATRALFTLFLVSVYCRSAPFDNSTENLGELVNTEIINDCDCNWRYLKHYDAKNCEVTKLDDCGCPKGFLCSNNKSEEEPITGCQYESKFYTVGSKISTLDNCQVCRCINNENPKVQCVSKECPFIDVPLRHNCHLLYKKNKCCPVGFKCISDEEKENTTQLCDYNNRLYPVGSKIYPEDDPCLVCDCTEDWNGISNSSCRQHECMLERNRHLLDAGCIPVYHESRCCPIEFYCPHNDLAYFSPANVSKGEITVEFDSQCLFAGQLYPRDSELPINNSCVECKCVTPPDFTCIHMSCPVPPNAENCYAKRMPGNCCPSYECLYGDESVSESNGTICPTPLCADSSCRIEIPPDSDCPTCICNSSYSSIEKNELQSDVEDFEDMEAKLVENDAAGKQEFEKAGEKLENDVPQLEKMLEEQLTNENSEVNDVTDLEKLSVGENNFNFESASDSNEVIEGAVMQETSNDDEREDMVFEFKKENDSSDAEIHTPMHKRSLEMNQLQEQESILDQEQTPFFARETEGGGEEYDDEIQSFKRMKPNSSQKLGSSHPVMSERRNPNRHYHVEVPQGCPTPMCEDSTCRIEIPHGHKCPTCVCRGN